MDNARTIALEMALKHHTHPIVNAQTVVKTAEAFLAFLQLQPPFTPKPMTEQERSDMAQKIAEPAAVQWARP